MSAGNMPQGSVRRWSQGMGNRYSILRAEYSSPSRPPAPFWLREWVVRFNLESARHLRGPGPSWSRRWQEESTMASTFWVNAITGSMLEQNELADLRTKAHAVYAASGHIFE